MPMLSVLTTVLRLDGVAGSISVGGTGKPLCVLLDCRAVHDRWAVALWARSGCRPRPSTGLWAKWSWAGVVIIWHFGGDFRLKSKHNSVLTRGGTAAPRESVSHRFVRPRPGDLLGHGLDRLSRVSDLDRLQA